jgi:hypothetical protein
MGLLLLDVNIAMAAVAALTRDWLGYGDTPAAVAGAAVKRRKASGILALCACSLPILLPAAVACCRPAEDDGVLLLTLALAADRRLAAELYPVCRALADSVAAGCSMVTCSSVDDLAALLDSPRWGIGSSKQVTGLRVTGQDEKRPAAELDPPAAAPASLCVWAKTAHSVSDAAISQLLSLTPKFPGLRLLELSGRNTLSGTRSHLASTLAAAAPSLPQLTHLNLEENQLGSSALKVILEAAQHWPQLQHLNLSWNNLTDSYGAKAVAAAAHYFPHLRHLNLGSNQIDIDGMRALAGAAHHWPDLQELYLQGNREGMGWQGTEVLVEAGRCVPGAAAAAAARECMFSLCDA